MNPVDVLLRSFDDAWKHPWESLASATAGVGGEEAGWQPPAHAAEPHDDGIGRPGTILWALNHLTHCHRHYATILRMRPVATQPETPPPGELPLDRVLPALEQATQDLRDEVARVPPEALSQPCTSTADVAGFVAMATRHMVWHASQARLTRRLYARRA